MLNHEHSAYLHTLQNASLIFLSLVWLPFDTLVLCFSLLLRSFLSKQHASYQRPERVQSHGSRLTVLLTGVGMTKGLALARLFHKTGHTVIGADFGPYVCGRKSAALMAFYCLKKPCDQYGSSQYVDNLVTIIEHNKVDLWISCSGVASAVEDAEAKEAIEKLTTCRAVQFNVVQTSMLHEKHTFIEQTQSLGLVIPETHTITASAAAEKILLNPSKGKQYIMKCIRLDDSTRGDMTLLPCPSPEETRRHVAKMHVSPQNPWIIQEYVRGREYCTHSLVIRGHVKAFVACPSSELLMHYEALPSSSPLSLAMLDFTKAFAANGGSDFTGHLSFDFMVKNSVCAKAEEVVLYPIECNPRAHTAVVLFSRTPELVDAYLSLLDPAARPFGVEQVLTPTDPGKYHWVGHDLVNEVVLPILHTAIGRQTLSKAVTKFSSFTEHLFGWRDGTFEVWDPLPWWWLYHVYWPMEFLDALVNGRKWSRINVSTTKIFMC